MFQLKNAINGCLLGAAVGDALGLPMEGLSRRRQQKMYPEVKGYHFLFGKGTISDDTEHTCLVAQAIIASGGDEEFFSQDFAWRLKKWLFGLPPGIGLATLRAILKLSVGFPVQKSGVFSAGNGPAMRSAIIGVCYGDQSDKLKNMVRISTRITHTDPKAEHGSLAVALAAYLASRHQEDPSRYLHTLKGILDFDTELLEIIKKAIESVNLDNSTETFADNLGLDRGVSGYIYHTVPVVLHTWFRHPRNFQAALVEAIKCGGDTDTVASILGGIIGASIGREGIPDEMITNLWSWPITLQWMESVGEKLCKVISEGKPQDAPKIPFLGVLLRNIVFMFVVLFHGFRRLLPPY